jgi:hypothetical protein
MNETSDGMRRKRRELRESVVDDIVSSFQAGWKKDNGQ